MYRSFLIMFTSTISVQHIPGLWLPLKKLWPPFSYVSLRLHNSVFFSECLLPSLTEPLIHLSFCQETVDLVTFTHLLFLEEFPWVLQVLFQLAALIYLYFYDKSFFNHAWLSPCLFDLSSDIEDYSRFNANSVEVFQYIIETLAYGFIKIFLLKASIIEIWYHRFDTICKYETFLDFDSGLAHSIWGLKHKTGLGLPIHVVLNKV